MTSSNSSEDVRLAYEAGANSYLVKPVEFTEMIKMIKNLSSYWLEMNQKLPPGGYVSSAYGRDAFGNSENAS